MNKFLSIISLFLFSFGMFNVSYAECGTINLTCTQDLELKWTSTGQSPYSCVVGGAGWPGSNECNSQNVSGSNSGWVRIPSANISEGTSYYTFRGEPIVQPPTNMTDTCTIVKATGCNTSGSYSISANPNPVKICSPATTGSSNISWTAPAGQNVDVWVVGNPNKFANVIGSGSALANWIQVGVPATFELKKYNSSTVEATVTVTGTSDGCSTGSGYCGDGIEQTPNSSGVNEDCDLGAKNVAGGKNGVPGSGCSSTCTTETTSPLLYYCQTSSMCSSCGGTTGVTCPSSGTYNSSACGGACPDAPPGTPSADIGFNSSYIKNKTINLPAGQTATSTKVFAKSKDMSPSMGCFIKRKKGTGNWGYQSGWLSPNVDQNSTTPSLTAGTYYFEYECQDGTKSAQATLTINNAAPVTPSVSCLSLSPVVPTTFNWSANNFSSAPTCTISNGVSPQPEPEQILGNFTVSTPGTYIVSCTKSAETASANCVAQAAPVCGNGIVEPPEECDGDTDCSPSCQNEDDDDTGAKLNSTCDGVIIPSRILVGKSFNVSPTFGNSGTTVWTSSFSSISNGLSPNTSKNVQSNISQYGTFSPSYQFTAPSSAGSFTLSFRMRDASDVPFGATCSVNGNFVLPECRDRDDNDGDGLTDYENSDPGCSSADDDDETDPASGATLKISANPQLVRYGGSSNVSYEVGNCKVTDGEGNLVDGPWTLLRDGAQIGTGISGIGTTNGSQAYPVNNIQNKTTFTLSCGGTTRSATISVIKINEI